MGRRNTWRPRLVVVRYADSREGAKLLSEARRIYIRCLAEKDKAKGVR